MKTLIFCLLAVVVSGCSARRGEPLTGARRGGDPQVEHGRVVFMRYCQKCHPGGESGLAPGINDKPLPECLIKLQVRVGLGAMPSFGRDTIDDRELDDVVRYLKALRGNRT